MVNNLSPGQPYVTENNSSKTTTISPKDLSVMSSGKWSDPVHFLKSQGKIFLSFRCTLFYIFLTPKIINQV